MHLSKQLLEGFPLPSESREFDILASAERMMGIIAPVSNLGMGARTGKSGVGAAFDPDPSGWEGKACRGA